jgi:hypothetical protein
LKLKIKNIIKLFIFVIQIYEVFLLVIKGQIKPSHVFFICAKEDHGIRIKNATISQILDPMRYQLEERKILCASFFWCEAPKNSISQFYPYYPIFPFLHLPFGLKVFFALFGKPKVICAIGWNKSILEYAKKNNILTVEPIHGFGLGKSDYVWGTKQNIKYAPDIFLAYDNQTFETLKSNKYKKFKVIRCAHHGFDRQTIAPFMNKRLFKKTKKSIKSKKIILVTLQHGYDGARKQLNHLISNGLIHDELAAALKSLSQKFIIIKAHPVQIINSTWQDTLKKLKSIFHGYKFIDTKKFHCEDIFELLKITDLHITMGSGSIVEASLMGVPSIALCPSLAKNGILSDAFDYAKAKKLLIKCPLQKEKIVNSILTCQPKKNIKKLHKIENSYPTGFTVLGKMINYL